MPRPTPQRLERLRRALALEGRRRGLGECPGPPLEIREGTRAELEAWPEAPDCPLCGRPLAGHGPDIRFIEVVTDDAQG
jgi:hypothetical protein